MSITSAAELRRLRTIGRIVREALDTMAVALRAGATTAEIDRIGGRVLARYGAESAPRKVYGFPGAVCISVNDEALHGIPGSRVLRAGDLVKLDLVAEKDGFFADAAVTVRLGDVTETADALVRCAEEAFRHGSRAARAGRRVSDIGRAVERTVRAWGFSVMPEFCGHGVGRTIHEHPSVPNVYDARHTAALTNGLVLTIEPVVASGSGRGCVQPDRWTIRTADGSLAAHYEHTMVVTKGEPILVTA